MAYVSIDTGTPGSKLTGDSLNAGAIKINTMFSEIYTDIWRASVPANRFLASANGSASKPNYREIELGDMPTTGAVANEILSFDGTAPVWNTPTILQTPIGSVVSYILATPPTNWINCDGTTIGAVGSGADSESADYEALFNLVKTSFGNAGTESFSGGSTVILPDMRGRSMMGQGQGTTKVSSGNVIDQTGTDRAIGDTAGSENYFAQAAELQQHLHSVTYQSFSGPTVNGVTSVGYAHSASQATTASSIQSPIIVVNFIIKYK